MFPACITLLFEELRQQVRLVTSFGWRGPWPGAGLFGISPLPLPVGRRARRRVIITGKAESDHFEDILGMVEISSGARRELLMFVSPATPVV